MSRKRGKLSTEEEEFIRAQANNNSIANIAIHLNRTEDTIKDFCRRNHLTYSGMSENSFDDTVLRQKLAERPYWAEIQNQFTDEELEYFVVTWMRLMKQFQENILYTEELQAKQWITLEIICNRVLSDRRKAIEQVDRLQALLDVEYDAPEEVRDNARITALETELSMIRNSLGSYTTEHSKILDRIKDIQRDLKMARADRIKKVEDSKSSWAGLMKALQEEEIRSQVGVDLTIMSMARENAKKEFSKFHQYEDGQWDQPLLTAETAKEE